MLEDSMRRRSSCRKMLKKSYSRSQMEQSSCLEDIRFSEDPPQFGITLHEAKSTTTFFKESRTGLNRQTRTTVKPEMIFGPSLGIIFIVITLNQELNSMCRLKNHSQYHSSALTLSSGRMQHWMCCWRAVLTIIGTSMVAGNHGPVSRSSED